ncbi:FAD-binding protein [Ferrovum sp. PN-J185]|uniref:GMC oxidoreductase n=1 Tax=Ferrovum sp. PN-J185 TaxID=1356306 RepID=UPI001E40D561|nr:GMC oxidoreductase [Ferrovum sp. PN-J185]MCC6067963.1 FAD-binding protein [Ferrovum sp. PN-J185]
MIVDLDKSSLSDFTNNQFDVCIIGSGAAGITLAIKLSEKNLKVALCEGGGLDYSINSQDSYKGKETGDPYLTLEGSRLRFFGGSTNHWAGWCRPFSAIDFKRGYLGKEFEWPITEQDLNPYLQEACNILEIQNDFEYPHTSQSDIKGIKTQFSPPVRFAKKYKKKLSDSQNIVLFLNSNLTELNGSDKHIRAAYFKSFSGNTVTINAKKFVFAMGGIENSRFLLWFKEKYKDKFFDTSTPIGQYWMEHPHFTLGQAIVDYQIGKVRFYSLKNNIQIQQRILGCGFRMDLQPEGATESMIKEVSCLAPKLGRQLTSLAEKNLICGVRFRAAWEQAPTLINRISLLNDKDYFGIPRINLNWQKQPIDRLTLTQSLRTFNNWILNNNIGRIQLQDWLINNLDYPTNDELAGNHHMGGTRMASDVRFGVIDSNCQVFGSDNLYVAGSSVFTTSGANNPTLPIIQLSLRLADYLIT